MLLALCDVDTVVLVWLEGDGSGTLLAAKTAASATAGGTASTRSATSAACDGKCGCQMVLKVGGVLVAI